MKHKYDRGIDLSSLRVLLGGQEVHLQRKDVFRELRIGTIVRILEAEYPEAGSPGESFCHFGLPIQGDGPGTIAGIPRIVEPGFFRKMGQEELPLLSFEDIWTAVITERIEAIPYDALTSSFFKNPIGKARDPNSLRQLILSRYRDRLPDLSDEEILGKGVSIRKLRLIKKVSLTKLV